MPTKVFCLLFLISFCIKNYAQGGTWVWVKGSDTAQPAAVYGKQGVPDINNTPRGVWSAANWIDTAGNFWIFSGAYYKIYGYRQEGEASLSDLWRYEPTKNTWTWMKGPAEANVPPDYGSQGIASPENNPGSNSFGFLCWTDKNDNLWLYGGNGVQSSDALWKYNIASNEWIWINGSNDAKHFAVVYGDFQQPSPFNSPGSRGSTSAAWVDDNNNLWFFGGEGGGPYNFCFDDMWRYNTNTNEWTWMKGPQGQLLWGSAGNYGVKGIEAATNNPPARVQFSHWQDKEGYLYIYGGYSGVTGPCLSDVWRYNPITNNWTWIAGDSATNTAGNYIQYCDGGVNIPVSRCYSSSPQTLTCSDNFYVYGGLSNVGIVPKFGTIDLGEYLLNDLWVYNTENNNWEWLSGSNGYNNLGNYGVMGVAAPTNQMPARYGQCMWVDKDGVLWVFGGIGADTGVGGRMPCCQIQTKNDLWKFIPDTTCVQIRCTTPVYSDSINLFVPNAFTPNGDGINDRLTVFAKNIAAYDIKIFDRWGELVYSSNDVTELNDTTRGWDGSYKGVIQNPGVFAFTITVQDMNGKVFSKKGSVTLLK